jgi:hypothetical protein
VKAAAAAKVKRTVAKKGAAPAKGKAVKKVVKATQKGRAAKKILKKEPEWTQEEAEVLDALDTPAKIQQFLDNLPYDTDEVYRSVRNTLRARKAHCVGGGMLAACCLERHGYGPARLFELRTIRDDDHVISIYQRNGLWGSVAKSNYTGLRGRDPVYASLRELAMSYHESCFNSWGEKTLRGYTSPLELSVFDAAISHKYGFKSGAWKFTMRDIMDLENDKHWTPVHDTIPGIKFNDKTMPEYLPNVSSQLLAAGLLGSNPAGLYIPGRTGSAK